MRVLIVNPNSTESMTDGIVAAAWAAASDDMIVDGLTNTDGPPAIQGPEDGDASVPGTLALIKQAADQGYDAAIIACFDDTGLQAAREAVPIPVIGIGQAAFVIGALHGRFSVITTLPVSVPVIEDNIAYYGLSGVCAKVHASGLPVLSLESDAEAATLILAERAREAAERDKIDALVLGCAGMAPFGAAMEQASGLPSVDGVAAAVGLARAAVKASA